MVGDVLESLRSHFEVETEQVEVAVEDVPLLPVDWADDVPLSTIVTEPGLTRIVLFRLPIAHRCLSDSDLLDLVWQTILDRLAEVWHMSPDDLDPRPKG